MSEFVVKPQVATFKDIKPYVSAALGKILRHYHQRIHQWELHTTALSATNYMLSVKQYGR